MYKGKKASLVFPAFNEEEYIAEAISDFKKLRIIDEIVVVDNNSTDNTAKIALKKKVKVVSEKKQGYGFAIIRGLREAKGDYIFICEPEGTFIAKDALRFLKKIEEFDVVIGTRTNPKYISKKANMGFLLRFGNIFLAKFIQILYRSGFPISDCGCTYRLIKKEVIKKILPKLSVGGSYFLAELLALTILNNFKVLEIPVHYNARVGESKITGSLNRAIWVGLSMLITVLKYRFRGVSR